MKKLSRDKYILIIFFIGIILRIIFAYYYPLTFDEGWSQFTKKISLYDLYVSIRADSTTPILTYLVHRFFSLSDTEFGVRISFFIFSISSIFFIYMYSNGSFISLLLSCFSLLIIKDGIIARMHSVSLFLSSVIIYYFHRTFEDIDKKKFIIFTVASIFLAFNFLPAIALIFSLFIFWYLNKEKSISNKKYYLLSFLFIFISSLLSILIFIDFDKLRGNYVALRFPSGGILHYIVWAFVYSYDFINYSDIKNNILYFGLTFLPLVYVLFKIVNSKIDFKIKYSVFNLFFSLLIVFIFSIKIPKLLYSVKYVIWLYPFFIYLFSHAIEQIKSIFIKYSFILIVILINLFSYYNALFNNNEDWEKTTKFIYENYCNDAVYVYTPCVQYVFSFYYKKQFNVLPKKPNDFDLKKIKDDKFILVVSHDFKNKILEYKKVFKNMFKEAEYKDFKDIKIFVYKKI